MTYGDIIEALKYETAKLRLNTMNDERVIELVNELIRQKVFFEDFLGVIDRSYYRPDFLDAVRASMARLEIKVSETEEEAVWALLKYHISEMTEVQCDPLIKLDRLIADVYWDFDFEPLTKKYLGDSHGIEHLIGLYWDYDHQCLQYMPDDPPESVQEDFKKLARDYAQAWQAKYADLG